MRKLNNVMGLCIALMMSSMAFAKGQVKSTVISSDYSRNSISKITLLYGDRWDNQVVTGVDSIQTGAKFDINNIKTKTIRLKGAFRTAEEQQAQLAAQQPQEKTNAFKDMFKGVGDAFKGIGKGVAAKPDTLTQRLLTEYINQNNIGKEIFDYVLMVDGNGRFHYDLMVERSRWNATDADVQLDNASQVKTVDENGPALLANSYLIVYDAKETKIGETTDKNGNKKPVYMADVTGYVFAIDSAEEVIGNIVHNMWINDGEEASVVAQKRDLYRNVRIPMKCIAAQSASTSSEKSMEKAISSSYDDILRKLENKISAWEVTATPEDVRPYITAKVGTKEGLKNGQRFKIFKNKGDEEEGNLRTVKVGYARATEINNNNEVATGNTGVSSFYQISGRHLKGTEFLKQSNDIRLGVSLDYNYNGLGMGANNKIFGAYSMVDLTIDYLAYIHKCGISHYARLNVGYDINTAKQLEEGANENGTAWYTYADGKNAGQAIFGKGVSYVNVAVGYACGLKVKQVMEFQPFINVGLDIIVPHGFDNSVLTNLSTAVLGETINFTDKTAKQTFGLFIDPGMRIVFNCGYPFQLFIQANYSVGIMQWNAYKVLNEYAKQCGYGHGMGLGAAAGVKWTF